MLQIQWQKGGYESTKMSPNHPTVKATTELYKKFGKEVKIFPMTAGGTAMSFFSTKLNRPFAFDGLGHGGRAHAPMEYSVIKREKGKAGGLYENELFLVSLLDLYATILA